MNLIGTAFAQTLNNIPITPPTPITLRFTTLGQVINFATNLVFLIGVALTIIFLIIGGIRYVTSGGDKEAATQARSMITNAVIGFVIVIGAWAIKQLVVSTLAPSGGTIP